MPRPLDVLVLYMHVTALPMRPTMASHLRFLERGAERHRIVYFNLAGRLPRFVRQQRYDLVVLHYSVLAARWTPRFERIREATTALRDSGAVVVAMPQDEYDAAHVLDDWLVDVGVQVVFSIFDGPARDALYPRAARDRAVRAVPDGLHRRGRPGAAGAGDATPCRAAPRHRLPRRLAAVQTRCSRTDQAPACAGVRRRRARARPRRRRGHGGIGGDVRWCLAGFPGLGAVRARLRERSQRDGPAGGGAGTRGPPARGRPRAHLRRVRGPYAGGLGWPSIHRDQPASLRGGPGRLVPATRPRSLRRSAGAGTALHPARGGPQRHRRGLRACPRRRAHDTPRGPRARRRGGERPLHLRRLRAAIRGRGGAAGARGGPARGTTIEASGGGRGGGP